MGAYLERRGEVQEPSPGDSLVLLSNLVNHQVRASLSHKLLYVSHHGHTLPYYVIQTHASASYTCHKHS